MTFIEEAKKWVGGLPATAKNEIAAHREKGESDVAADPKVAGSRAGDDGTDGNYVGRTSPDSDSGMEQSGAEARSEETRRSR